MHNWAAPDCAVSEVGSTGGHLGEGHCSMYKSETACRMYKVMDWVQRLIKAGENQKYLLDCIDMIENERNIGRNHHRRLWWWVCNVMPNVVADRNRYKGGVRANHFDCFMSILARRSGSVQKDVEVLGKRF